MRILYDGPSLCPSLAPFSQDFLGLVLSNHSQILGDGESPLKIFPSYRHMFVISEDKDIERG